MTSLKTSIKIITYLSDIGCLEIQGASLLMDLAKDSPDAKQELLERLLSGKRMTGRDEMDIKRILKTKEALDNIRNFIDKQQLTNSDTPKKSTVPNEDKKGIR
ncbi:hypothetical protein FGAF829_45400 (plasmid) [Escherichia coli]|nr:hypothetical protein FGAF829_45400 [Escherichia coli]